MDMTKASARAAGALLLIAMASSLVGGSLLDPVLGAPGSPVNVPLVWTGAALELIGSIAVVGIAAALFPILKRHDREGIALGYVGLRVVEAVFCAAGAIVPLLLVAPSQADHLQASSALLIAARTRIAGLLIPVFFGASASLLYYLLFRSKLVPRFISIWGIVGVVSMLTLNFSGVGMVAGIILALPIITNEVTLGIWLIAKGFDPRAVAPGPATAGP